MEGRACTRRAGVIPRTWPFRPVSTSSGAAAGPAWSRREPHSHPVGLAASGPSPGSTELPRRPSGAPWYCRPEYRPGRLIYPSFTVDYVASLESPWPPLRPAAHGPRSSPTAVWARSYSAVPRCAPPRRRTCAPERRLAPRRLHQRRRGADRDEQLRREPAQARAHFLEDELEQINSTGGEARARGARDLGRDVFIAGSIGPIGEPSRAARTARALRRAGRDPRGPRRRPVHGRDVLRPRRSFVDAIEAVRGVSSLPIVTLMTFDEGRDARRRRRTRARGASGRPRHLRDRREPRRRACWRRSRRSSEMQRRRQRARRPAERRPCEPAGRPRLFRTRRRSTSRSSPPRARRSARG